MNPQKKILIVDDENFIRLLLHRTLEDFEFENVQISVASDGEQGLAMALEQTPDLVFLDLMMPGLDGLEVCQRIRQNTYLYCTPDGEGQCTPWQWWCWTRLLAHEAF